MRFKYLLHSSFILFVIGFSSCRSFDSISEERDKLERSRTVYLLDTAVKDILEISYYQGGVDMNMRLYLDEHEFELEFDKNSNDSRPMTVNSTSMNQSKLKMSDGSILPGASTDGLKKDMSQVVYYYNLAQTKFYADDYQGSLNALDSSLAIMPTSDAYALKGSILFVMNKYELAMSYWKEAKRLDPKFEIPNPVRK
jgi:tetratricopeptide (TPR) repeat protein